MSRIAEGSAAAPRDGLHKIDTGPRDRGDVGQKLRAARRGYLWESSEWRGAALLGTAGRWIWDVCIHVYVSSGMRG